MIRLLRQRNFALLWFGGLVSVAGDWVLYAALPFFVFERTHSTIATAGMIAAELGPSILIGSFAGVYVDRLDRRRLLVVTNALQALAVTALLVVAHGGPLWVVYAVAAGQSVLASFSQPAESALLPSLVAPEVLLAANSLTALNSRLARLVGVPLGGLLLGLFGLTPVVLADGASFLAAGLMIAGVTVAPRVRTAEPASFSGEWREGLRVIRRERAIAVLFGVLGLMTFGGTMLDPLYVAWVRDALHRGPQIYALLLTAHSVAGIFGSLAAGVWGARFTPRVLVGWTSLIAGAALIVKFDVPRLELALALSLLGGATSVVSSVAIETLVQTTVREDFRGRVFAALGASGALFSLAGALVGGVAAQSLGVTPMLNVAAGLVIVAGVVVLRALRD
ncbi:MAG TPA: MFS transporter [Gaiellaceae bacterium]|nr:MFS transporter [Gaiellaceae bacterium]